ncbi:MAG: 2OG-Fe(II) oxygenase [Alphaproteobacteria bacterium]|nr:2OG-Fe(II) oxygenase [Alphaproteobacteria bacterium]
MPDGLTAPPQDLIDAARYPLADAAARARIVAAGRKGLAHEGCAMLPRFVTPAGTAAMAAEAMRLLPRSNRRDLQLCAYANQSADGFPADHPRRRVSPFRQHVIGADDFAPDGPVMRLYRWDGLTRLVADLLELPALHRVADPLLSCNVTIMGEGDQHGWHFDSNDFVVSLLLQAPERGGHFVFAPGIRSESDPNYDRVARALDGDPAVLRMPEVSPGTLALFRGKHSIHRVTPIEGARPRIIALFSYDRRPDMNFTERSRMNVLGRSRPRAATAQTAGGKGT